MGTNMMRALLLTSASVAMVATAAPTTAYAQEASYQIDIPAQGMGDALRALGKATKQNIVFSGAVVKGKRSAAVRGRMSAGEALDRMLAGSGLKMSRGSGGGLVVLGGNGDAAPARTEAPATAAQVSVSANASTVVDARTGAALKGALVEIVETGDKTSTGNLGDFRFPGKNGSFNIRISYLGYPQYEQYVELRDGRATSGILLSDGSATGEIVVTAYQSARAQALNQERTSENVTTVISSDLLGDFTGTTIAESLRKAPGVAFQRDSFGDGTNIIVRGLAPDFNTIKFNGIELPEGSGTGRTASLGNILTESVSQVKISKTLLPNQDTAGTGGLVEIETKTPLDRPARYFSATLEGALRDKGFNDEFLAAGTASMRFGQDRQFGVSASVQYRKRNLRTSAYSLGFAYGQYLPLDIDGPTINNPDYVDPRIPFPFEDGADAVYPTTEIVTQNDNNLSNLGITLAAAWQISDNAKVSFDYQRLDQSSTYYNAQSNIGAGTSYTLRPITGLGGAQRQALEWTGLMNLRNTYTYSNQDVKTDVLSLRGDVTSGKWEVRYGAGYTKGSTDSRNYSLVSGDNRITFTAADVLPEAEDPVEGRIASPFSRRDPGQGGFPRLLLTDAAIDRLTNNGTFGNLNYSQNIGSNRRYTGEASARYNFDGANIKYIEFGASFEDSKFKSDSPLNEGFYPIGSPTFAQLGLNLNEAALSDVGLDTPLKFAPQRDVIDFFQNRAREIAVECFTPTVPTCPSDALLRYSLTPYNPLLGDAFTREKEFAAYAQASLKFGKIEVIGGVRFSHIDIETNNLNGPQIYDRNFALDRELYDNNLALVSVREKQSVFLPRILANYRPNDRMVFRGGYYYSVARPPVSQMSQTPFILVFQAPFFGPLGDQGLVQIIAGNAKLKPASTHNFDFSAEYYDENIGVIKIGAFYKQINNILENIASGSTADLDLIREYLPDDPKIQDILDNPEDYSLSITVPENNDSPAHIWGLEASLERQFKSLPGWLGGFGVYANLTYTNSSRTQLAGWSFSPVRDAAGNLVQRERINYEVPNVRFAEQPKYSGTASLTYSKSGIDANLSYTYQTRRQTQFLPNNLHRFEEGYGTLDFRAEYRFGKKNNVRIFFEAADLLRGTRSPANTSSFGAGDDDTPAYYYGSSYNGGRQGRLGATISF